MPPRLSQRRNYRHCYIRGPEGIVMELAEQDGLIGRDDDFSVVICSRSDLPEYFVGNYLLESKTKSLFAPNRAFQLALDRKQ